MVVLFRFVKNSSKSTWILQSVRGWRKGYGAKLRPPPPSLIHRWNATAHVKMGVPFTNEAHRVIVHFVLKWYFTERTTIFASYKGFSLRIARFILMRTFSMNQYRGAYDASHEIESTQAKFKMKQVVRLYLTFNFETNPHQQVTVTRRSLLYLF